MLAAFVGLVAALLLVIITRLVATPISKRMHSYRGAEWIEVLFCRLALSNTPTCKAVDDIVNLAIDSDSYVDSSSPAAEFSGCDIWIANWPYAYGAVDFGVQSPLPSAKTQVRLRRYLAEKGVRVWS